MHLTVCIRGWEISSTVFLPWTIWASGSCNNDAMRNSSCGWAFFFLDCDSSTRTNLAIPFRHARDLPLARLPEIFEKTSCGGLVQHLPQQETSTPCFGGWWILFLLCWPMHRQELLLAQGILYALVNSLRIKMSIGHSVEVRTRCKEDWENPQAYVCWAFFSSACMTLRLAERQSSFSHSTLWCVLVLRNCFHQSTHGDWWWYSSLWVLSRRDCESGGSMQRAACSTVAKIKNTRAACWYTALDLIMIWPDGTRSLLLCCNTVARKKRLTNFDPV